jgi:hypothetical protein
MTDANERTGKKSRYFRDAGILLFRALRKLGAPFPEFTLKAGGERPETATEEKLRFILNQNKAMGIQLRQISKNFIAADENVKKKLEHQYHHLGPYTDLGRIDTEIELMKHGTNVELPEISPTEKLVRFKPEKEFEITISEGNDLTLKSFAELRDAILKELQKEAEHEEEVENANLQLIDIENTKRKEKLKKYGLPNEEGQERREEEEPTDEELALREKSDKRYDSQLRKMLVQKKLEIAKWIKDNCTNQRNRAELNQIADEFEKTEEGKLRLRTILAWIRPVKLTLDKKLKIGKQVLYHFEGDRPEYKEKLSVFGWEYRIPEIIAKLNSVNDYLESIRDPDTKSKVVQIFNPVQNAFKKLFEQVKKNEKSFHDTLGSWRTLRANLQQYRSIMLDPEARPLHVHFEHTYNVTKQFYVPPEKDGHVGLRDETKTFEEIHPEFKRPDEVKAGLDERGMPLEVYEDGDKYFVLTDYWINKTYDNKWQRQIIEHKFGTEEAGKFFDQSMRRPRGDIRGREVDRRFIEPIDLLKLADYIYVSWDAYRDDFRDGRYHKHSKSVLDYVIAAQPYDLEKDKVLLKRLIPTKKIRVGWHMKKRNPDSFKRVPVHEDIRKDEHGNIVVHHKGDDHSLPRDERKIIRDFRMKVYNPHTKKLEMIKGLRRPHHLNPAYDRTALALASGKKGESADNVAPWIHWGTLYYYETAADINKYSENPDPALSTRGIGKYLIDRTLRDAGTFDEARNTLRKHTFDLGVRAQSEDLVEDPLGDIKSRLKYGKYIGQSLKQPNAH